jgi:hypothetical protein
LRKEGLSTDVGGASRIEALENSYVVKLTVREIADALIDFLVQT